MRRGRSDPTALSELVPRVLSDLGFDAAVAILRVAERWEEAVGPEIARHCRPTALRGGALEAEVDSSVWCQQLALRTPEILAALRELWGDEAPSSLRLQVGARQGRQKASPTPTG